VAKENSPRRRAVSQSGGVHGTASARRRIVIEALDRELDLRSSDSIASNFSKLANDRSHPQQLIVSGDIDGLVSAALLCSVLPEWKVVAVIFKSDQIWLAPTIGGRPSNLFGIDVFSLCFSNISNHIEYYGPKRLQVPQKLKAFQDWDAAVLRESQSRIFVNPNIWAGIGACYEDANHERSAKYKYPLGTAHIMLALLEVCGLAPRFYDRRYLPWLVANCDGGVNNFFKHGYNADVWWPTLAAAVGPGSLSESVYLRVAHMRPQDFNFEVNSLARELFASNPSTDTFLNDEWNLTGTFPKVWIRALKWLLALTGWHDPILGGTDSLDRWVKQNVSRSEKVPLGSVATTAAEEASVINDAHTALNANFFMGGRGDEGSRFNWVSGW